MKYVTWFFGFIIIVLAVIFGVILIRNTIRSSDFANSSRNSLTETNLTDYLHGGVTLRLHIYGPVVAPENHREIQSDITDTSRTIRVLSGYNGEVIKSTSLSNTKESFREFGSALDRAGFTTERVGGDSDPIGACATGTRYQVQILENSKVVKDLWRSTCTESAPGNFGGSMQTVAQLFKLQFPDYNKSIDNTLNNSGLSIF